MVKRRPAILFFAVLAAVTLASCAIEYYDDYDSRFEWRNEFRFVTNFDPLSGAGDDYEFIVVSDTHIDTNANEFAWIKNHIGAARFIAVTGDVTGDGKREQIRQFINAANGFSVPCYPILGNHDIYEDRGRPWRELIGSSTYRIDSGSTTLFFLDNANGYFGYDQLEWLEKGLKSARQHVFVFAHENFFTTSTEDAEQTTDMRERALVLSLLRGHCEAMFMGHLHKRNITEYGGTHYIMLENFDAEQMFCRVRVRNGGISWTFEQARP
jgi:predicted phosphodiesterase